MIKYCKKCLLPSTKPYVDFHEGICSACVYHAQKNKSSNLWKKKKEEFFKIIKKIKKNKINNYHALVPVSGGKDSISQVARLLNEGLKILAVNVDYGIKTEIGHYNLSLIPKMGVDLLTFRPEQNDHIKMIKYGFLKYGDPDLASHCLLHAYPIRVAYNLGIPLVFLGENSAEEYSGEKKTNIKIDHVWFKKYAANSGFDIGQIKDKLNLNSYNLKNYQLIESSKLKKINAVFCSSYFFWDSNTNLKIAQKYGFKSLSKNQEGTYRNFHGIDEKINRIHQYFKVLKLGYGRATDHACEDIRNKYISRDEGKRLIKKFDTTELSDYFVKDFIDYIKINKKQFFQTVEKFRNKKIWTKKNNKWTIDYNW